MLLLDICDDFFCCGVRYCNKEILKMVFLYTRETRKIITFG